MAKVPWAKTTTSMTDGDANGARLHLSGRLWTDVRKPIWSAGLTIEIAAEL
jgi:hypothetical protein